VVIFIQLDREGTPRVFTPYKDADVVLIDWRDSLNRPHGKPHIGSIYPQGLEDVPQAFVDPDEN
jgi:hypothetical protein